MFNFHFFPHPQYKWLLDIIGTYILFTGFGDGLKYHWQANAIRKVGIAKGHSRKFINMALHNDHARTFYFILFLYVMGFVDIYLLLCTLVAIIFMTELWFTIYFYYPYRGRGLYNFRRPSLWTYFINSLISNKIRKRL